MADALRPAPGGWTDRAGRVGAHPPGQAESLKSGAMDP